MRGEVRGEVERGVDEAEVVDARLRLELGPAQAQRETVDEGVVAEPVRGLVTQRVEASGPPQGRF